MTAAARERVVVVGLARGGLRRTAVEDHLDELVRLVDAAGGTVVSRLVREHARPDPATFIGRGQAEEVAGTVAETEAQLVIFDDDLSPAQARNLEKVLGARILDRSGLILDIFVRRARSHEARTQVELAHLEYLLPRLTRRWSHLERQEGRIGSRGVGETQLELDRRIIKTRIAKLRRDLKDIGKQRRQRRSGRSGLFRVAVVGYTNAGKSTLMSRLTGADVFVEDRLFATVDALVRRVPRSGQADAPPIVLIDTVGFIRKLPHGLVASFRSTLEEIGEADLILHVVDASHPGFEEHARTTVGVLEEIGALPRPLLLVLNKMDRIEGPAHAEALARAHPDAALVSAATGTGIPELLRRIRSVRDSQLVVRTFDVPQSRGDVLAGLRAQFEVIASAYDDGRARLTVRGREAEMGRVMAKLSSAGEEKP